MTTNNVRVYYCKCGKVRPATRGTCDECHAAWRKQAAENRARREKEKKRDGEL